MKVGDLVSYCDRPKSRGVIIELKGKKIVIVEWKHGVIHDEHIDDILVLSEAWVKV